MTENSLKTALSNENTEYDPTDEESYWTESKFEHTMLPVYINGIVTDRFITQKENSTVALLKSKVRDMIDNEELLLPEGSYETYTIDVFIDDRINVVTSDAPGSEIVITDNTREVIPVTVNGKGTFIKAYWTDTEDVKHQVERSIQMGMLPELNSTDSYDIVVVPERLVNIVVTASDIESANVYVNPEGTWELLTKKLETPEPPKTEPQKAWDRIKKRVDDEKNNVPTPPALPKKSKTWNDCLKTTATFKNGFDEKELSHDLLNYIEATYNEHYSGGKLQATDLIIDSGNGTGFCLGNIIKYASRYGKKNGFDEKDIMKMLHYGLILLYVHRKENDKDT